MNILRKIWKNYLSGFKKFNDFSGRATRSEFWSFTLINILDIFALVYALHSPQNQAVILIPVWCTILGYIVMLLSSRKPFLFILLSILCACATLVVSYPLVFIFKSFAIVIFAIPALILICPIFALWKRRMNDIGTAINNSVLIMFIVLGIALLFGPYDNPLIFHGFLMLFILCALFVIYITLLPSKKISTDREQTTDNSAQ